MLSKQKVGVSLLYFAKEVRAIMDSAKCEEEGLFLTFANAEELAYVALEINDDEGMKAIGGAMVDGDPDFPELTLEYFFMEFAGFGFYEQAKPFPHISALQDHAKHYRRDANHGEPRLEMLVGAITALDKYCRGVRVPAKLQAHYDEFNRELDDEMSFFSEWEHEKGA